jgi:ribose transport system permease protein
MPDTIRTEGTTQVVVPDRKDATPASTRVEGLRTATKPGPFVENLGRLRIGRFSGLILIVVLIVVFGALIPDTFLTMTTATAVARTQAITIILSLSLMASLAAGVFDLSIGQNFGLGAIVCIILVTQYGWEPIPACVATVLICGAIGGINALLIVGVGIDSFIATLGVGSALLATSLFLSDSQFVGPVPAGFQSFTAWQPLGVPVLIVYALVLALIGWYVLEHTALGRRVYATGANPEAARLAGISTKKYVAGALVLTGLGCGIAAFLLASAVGSVSSSVGGSYLLPPFAACFLAATQIKPGRYNVGGLLVALFLLGIGVKGLSLMTGAVWIPDLFNGLALLLAVGLAVVFQRRAQRRSKRRAISTETGGTEE